MTDRLWVALRANGKRTHQGTDKNGNPVKGTDGKVAPAGYVHVHDKIVIAKSGYAAIKIGQVITSDEATERNYNITVGDPPLGLEDVEYAPNLIPPPAALLTEKQAAPAEVTKGGAA